MSLEHWWNDIEGGRLMSLEKIFCHFIHHKSHMDWHGINLALHIERPVIYCLSQGMAFVVSPWI
jgi:hypothetical protein